MPAPEEEKSRRPGIAIFSKEPASSWRRLRLVSLGILLGQFILYWPSLIGQKVLLPLDILAQPKFYIPRAIGETYPRPQDPFLIDLVCVIEPNRQFAISEFRAGRLPMWNPYEFSGAPFIWPKFSPFLLLQCLTRSPIILAWTQLVAALVGGIGMYQFCRRGVLLSFWASAFAGWCYPLTGFFILWQGFHTALPVYWLPWMLLSIGKTVRNQSNFEPLKLCVLTTIVLVVSGNLDVAAQVVMVSGIFGLWCVADSWARICKLRTCLGIMAKLAAPVLFGFLLAAPQILPVLEYVKSGSRYQERSQGKEERPPIGLLALPEVILPKIYGTTSSSSYQLFPKGQDNLQEGSASAYAGLLPTLFFVPLAWRSRSHRKLSWFCAFLIVFGLGWSLNIPGIVNFLRLPGLNALSHNRLAFITGFGLTVMAAIGVDWLLQHNPITTAHQRKQSAKREIIWPWWLWIAPAVLACVYVWSMYRAIYLPEPIRTQLTASLMAGRPLGPARSPEIIEAIQVSFAWQYAIYAGLSAAGTAGWLLLKFRPGLTARVLSFLGGLCALELLTFSYGVNPQCDPKLYYPEVPTLSEIAKASNGRVIGFDCLPATLASVAKLKDVRGYDAVDPARMVGLLLRVADPASVRLPYAQTQFLIPQAAFDTNHNLRLPGILNLLAVNHAIFRGEPPVGYLPEFQSPDYWAVKNATALPRVIIPKRVETLGSREERLNRLAAPEFDPGEVAFTETELGLPPQCMGTATIGSETSERVTVTAQMKTTGLLMLADAWDPGWTATVKGQSIPVLRVNEALRGVVLPTGTTTVDFCYEPRSFRRGLKFAGVAILLNMFWAGHILYQRRSARVRSTAVPEQHT